MLNSAYYYTELVASPPAVAVTIASILNASTGRRMALGGWLNTKTERSPIPVVTGLDVQYLG